MSEYMPIGVPERCRVSTNELPLLFARGALAARLAAQEKILDTLMTYPPEQRSLTQLGDIAQTMTRLHELMDLPDDQLLEHMHREAGTRRIHEILTIMQDFSTLTVGDVDAFYDEVDGLEVGGLISPELCAQFYKRNNEFFEYIESIKPNHSPLPATTVSPAAMPKQRPTHTATPPHEKTWSQEEPPVYSPEQQTILSMLADGATGSIRDFITAIYGKSDLKKEDFSVFMREVLIPLKRADIITRGLNTHLYHLAGVTPVRRRERAPRQVRVAHRQPPPEKRETPDDVVRRARQIGILPPSPVRASSTNSRTARTGVRTAGSTYR